MNDALVPLKVGVSTATLYATLVPASLTATPRQATELLLQSAGFVALALVLLFWSRRSVPSASGAVENVAS